MNQENLNDYYMTSDLGLATTISLYYPIDAIDHTSASKAQFLFRRDDRLDHLVEAYWKDELKVSPLQYFSQLRTVKSRLYGGRDGQ